MKNDDCQWLAPLAACLIILTASGVASACPPSSSGSPEPAAAPAAVSGSISSEQSAALAHQRLRRCQLHPGTCEQGKGTAPESAHGDGKNTDDAPDLKGVPRD
ncbi:MAG: hypothetical protein M3O41_11020 [Pseudomonadota bacterium]|nr:hypothetical protein [Pseudomonadota bacterium]